MHILCNRKHFHDRRGPKRKNFRYLKNTEKIMEPLSDLVGAEIQLKVDEFTPMQVE
ncbi:MAG: hypothetical protein CM1200mP6_07690 [Anaerolineaceae bacterium]|nr:MAG: hypothetical protein CM1200mP6_07690 [Anaerolineaceae bacterium]